jgi:isopentenyl-diphosphate Delta-isomerase
MSTMDNNETEQIVFVDEDGKPTGETGPKLASHTADTKLHLAFSCYILKRSDQQFLVTQRALSKKVWPGVWTNSVCGHPAPGENIEDAIRRRAKDELGIDQLEDIICVLPAYRYKTPPYKGIVENEFCPVFVAYTDQNPKPNPQEVEAYAWMPWADWAAIMEDPEGRDISYWAANQYKQLQYLEPFLTLETEQ